MRIVVVVVASLSACGPSPSDFACASHMVPGDLVITEVFADFKGPVGGTGADPGKEWFEIYNAADHPLALAGLRITHSRPDGTSPQGHTMTAVTLAPGQYLALGNAVQALVPGYVGYGYGTDLGELYNTAGGKLVLACADAEIDAASYADVKEGHARELTAAQPPDYTVNDDPASWCDGATHEFEPGNFGTPGMPNDCVPSVVGACRDGDAMRPIVKPAAGQLVITEVLADPAGSLDSKREWFEVANTGATAFDLDELALQGKPGTAAVIEAASCLPIGPGELGLFARSDDPAVNGALPVVDATFAFSLVDSAGTVSVLDGTTVLDTVTWATVTPGVSMALDPALFTTTDNDVAASFCPGTAAYGDGTNLGTPRAANAPCP